MFKVESIDELDRLLNLLSEYTDRSKLIYEDFNFRRRRLQINYFLIIVFIASLISYIIYREYNDFPKDMTSYSTEDMLIIMITGGAGLTAIMSFFSTKPLKYKSQKSLIENLWISRKQLKSLTVLFSQYLEHSDFSYVRNQEIRLRLIEAEEVLKITILKNRFFDKLVNDDNVRNLLEKRKKMQDELLENWKKNADEGEYDR